MVPIRDKAAVQIEVTNACNHQCSNCSRFVGHHREPYFMPLEQVERAIDSLEGFPGGIGIIGGEPLLHPDFEQICELMWKKVPPEKRFLWTGGYAWARYCQVVKKTFGENIRLNNHRDRTQKHHPMLLGIRDVVEDPALVRKLQERCWVDQRWSASINPKGGFFCEIAAAMDLLFDGPGGHPIVRGWWKKDPHHFSDQRSRYCYRCGACLPYMPVTLDEQTDVVSMPNYLHLKSIGSPKLARNRVKVIERTFSAEQLAEHARHWDPWDHRGILERSSDPAREHPYGSLYGYGLQLRTWLRSRWWSLAVGEVAVKRWLWRVQVAVSRDRAAPAGGAEAEFRPAAASPAAAIHSAQGWSFGRSRHHS